MSPPPELGSLTTDPLDRKHELAERLASDDEPTRLRAAQEVAAAETLEADASLWDAAADPSWRVRRATVQGLLTHGGQGMLAALLAAMRQRHRDVGLLNSVIQVLAQHGADTLAPLLELLTDEAAELRSYAARALGERGDRRAIPGLLAALDDCDANVRYHAIEALGKLQAVEAVDSLAAVAESRDFFVAFPALYALGSIGDRRVAPRLVPLLADAWLRLAAVQALGRLGGEAEVTPLAELLDQPDAPTVEIARALARMHGHYEQAYCEGTLIADLAQRAITEVGKAHLAAALKSAGGEQWGVLGAVLSWLSGPVVEQALVRLLSQPTTRQDALDALVRRGSRSTGRLLDQLASPDVETCQAVAVALGRIGDPRATPELVRILTTREELTTVAAGALAAIGDRRAFEPLLGLLGHPSATTRQAVIGALNSIGHPDMPQRIARLLTDPEPRLRESACRIAGYFGYPACVEALLGCIRDPEISVCCAAVEQLPYLEDERAGRLLCETLGHSVAKVRAAAARGLADLEDAASLTALLTALDDPDPWVRYFAARSLGRRTSPEALEPLARLIVGDPAPHVRAAAIQALGNLGGRRAVSILAPMAEAVEEDWGREALAALGQIAHPDAIPPLLAALQSPQPARRISALQALARQGRPETVETLRKLAEQDNDPRVVRTAIQTLGQLRTPAAVATLLELATTPACREPCIEALAQMDEQRVNWVARGLTHAHVDVRRAAVAALTQMKRPRASELLSAALDDPDRMVRLDAVTALGHLSHYRVECRLTALAEDDHDAEVRRAARSVLERQGP